MTTDQDTNQKISVLEEELAMWLRGNQEVSPTVIQSRVLAIRAMLDIADDIPSSIQFCISRAWSDFKLWEYSMSALHDIPNILDMLHASAMDKDIQRNRLFLHEVIGWTGNKAKTSKELVAYGVALNAIANLAAANRLFPTWSGHEPEMSSFSLMCDNVGQIVVQLMDLCPTWGQLGKGQLSLFDSVPGKQKEKNNKKASV